MTHHIKLTLLLSSDGKCNGVALWMNYTINKQTTITGGPIEPIKSGEYIKWDMDSRQGVHLFKEQHDVGASISNKKFKYKIQFLPQSCQIDFKFGVGA